MEKVNEILCKYSDGTYTVEETNKKLKEANYDGHVDPNRNVLTADEIAATKIGMTAKEVNGFGLLDSGTGSLDKVKITNGSLSCSVGNMLCNVIIGGKTFKVKENGLSLEV